MKKYSLKVYIIGVVIALIVVNCLAWFLGGETHGNTIEIFSSSFLLGMFAMYIAVHVYKS